MRYLKLTIEEAHEFFFDIPAVADRMKSLLDVGLGYIKLGQISKYVIREGNHKE